MTRVCVSILLVLAFCVGAWAGDAPPVPPTPPVPPAPVVPPVPPVLPKKVADVSGLKVTGHIAGENITFVLELTAKVEKAGSTIELVSGDVALEKLEGVAGKHRVLFDKGVYSLWVQRAGEHRIRMTFACRPRKVEKDEWRECSFTLPVSSMRELEVASDRPDLEVVFPNAMRVQRNVKNGVLKTTAILGVGTGFAVRWKPQVQELAGKLVTSAGVNAIATVSAAALQFDAIITYNISQGEAREFKVALPKTLSVTQVRGVQIQNWAVEAAGDRQVLTVTLTQAQKQQYALQVCGEVALAVFPADFELPVIEPVGTIQASGWASVGTDSAIHLKVKKAAGLTQTNANAFPRIVMDKVLPRALPARSTFCYYYSATPYQLAMTASDIKPSLDAEHQAVVMVRDDDMVLYASIDVDVRDAPVRELNVRIPAGFTVAEVTGNEVVPNGHEVHVADGVQTLRIPFKAPVMGHVLVGVRLEVGSSPLDRALRISGLDVIGAKNERGYLVLAADQGIQLEAKPSDKLRDVHTGSVPMRVARAQMAYRFREAGWSLELRAKQNPASVRCELFHLASIGEGVLYGSTTASFFITGAPVDKLQFRIPKQLTNVEFVGRDIQNQKQEGDVWTVTLRRRVMQYYTLLITSSQPYSPAGGTVIVGGIECLHVDTQVGYIAVASMLNLTIGEKDLSKGNLMTIDRDELPYRRLVNAPVLRAYKYVKAPHTMELTVKPYETGSLLGAVIDQMELRTTITESGEAVTTATYSLKNSNEQFLQLAMPAGARVWSAELVDTVNGQPVHSRLMVSQDDKGNLLIPLERRRDPSAPLRLVVVYGEAGKTELGLGHEYQLRAPQPQVTSKYAGWKLAIPKKFAFARVESTMANDTPLVDMPGLGTVAAGILRCYKAALGQMRSLFDDNGGLIFLVTVLIVVGLVFVGIFKKR